MLLLLLVVVCVLWIDVVVGGVCVLWIDVGGGGVCALWIDVVD